MGVFSSPKSPKIEIPKIDNSAQIAAQKALEQQQQALIKQQEELAAQKKLEADRAEQERIAEISKNLRNETALFARRGGGRNSLFSGNRAGFSLRTLLGG